MLRKILKWIAIIFLILILLFVIAWGLLQLPSVQTKIVSKVTDSLSETLGTKVAIDRVNIKFFKTLSAEGIYIEDQQQDTLLYASSLDANIGVLDLFGSEIFLNEVTLNDGYLNIYQHPGDTALNMNFLLEAFASDPDAVKDTTAAAWTFGLGKVGLNRTRIRYDDHATGMDLSVQSKSLAVALDKLDLENQQVRIDNILIDKTNVVFLSDPREIDVTDTVLTTGPIPFPYTGWDITLGDLEIKDAAAQYTVSSSATALVKKEGINFNDLRIADLDIAVKDLAWNKAAISAEIEQISFLEGNGLQVDEFKSKLTLTPQQIELAGFSIKTPYSHIDNNTKVTFDDFSGLVALSASVNIDTRFDNTEIGVRDIELLAPVMGDVEMVNIAALGKIYLNGGVTGNTKKINLSNTEISVGQALKLAVSGTATDIMEVDKMGFDVQLREFSTSYQKINSIVKGLTLPPGLAEFGTFNLSGAAKGTMADFNASQLKLETELQTGFALSGRLQNVTDPDQLYLNIDIENLSTHIKEIGYLLPDGLPANLDSLGRINYAGQFTGNLLDMELVGDLTTGIGSLTSDLKATFNEDYSDATYAGDLALKEMALNKILGDSLGVGTVSLAGKINGSGITPETIKATLDANINSAVYQTYEYKNLNIDGTIDRKKFTGELDMADANIAFDFQGLVDLNAEVPVFQFTMGIDTINFQELNLLDRELHVSGDLDFDFQASSINDLGGMASITNLTVSDSAQTYVADSILLFSGVDEEGNNELTLNAPFMSARINGDYDLEELPTLVLAYVNDYFPLEDLLTPDQQAIKFDDIETQQELTLRVEVLDITPIRMLALPDLEFAEKAILTGKFNSDKQTMNMSAELKKVVYGTNKFKKFSWKADGTNIRLVNDFEVKELAVGANEFPMITLNNILRQDSAYLQLNVAGIQDSVENLLQLGGVADRENGAYEMRFNEAFILNDVDWTIAPENLIRYDGQQLTVDNLALQDGVHQLIINTEAPDNAAVLIPDVTVDFDQFQLSEISALLVPDASLGGKINGKVRIMEPTRNLHFVVDLQIPDLSMNKTSIGALNVDIAQAASSSVINVDVGMKGENNNIAATGTYQIDNKNFNVNLDIQEMEMRLLDLMLVDIIADSKGKLQGNISLKGTPEKPDINGQINLNNISTLIEFTQARYAVETGKITLDNKTINLGELTLRDTANNTANLRGKLDHNFFTDIKMDLDLDTEKFLILNTTAADNPIFYGNLMLGAKVDVTGPIELPKVDVVANTLEGSEINISPFSETDVVLEEDFIIFGNPDTYVKPGDSLDVYDAKAALPVDVTLNLELSDNALLRIIVDPLTGDKLECRGNSNLAMRFLPSGLMEMFGTYTISSGQYGFSYSDVVRRNFQIVPGGTVFFNGDPLNSRFNVAAKYETKTTTYELISSEATLSPGETKQAQRRQPVAVVLNLDGNLAAPELAFDIELPEAQGSAVNSTIERKLLDLRNNPNELNKQVFGLLLINSFIVSSSSTNLGDVGENVVLSSVSKLFASQLNNLAEKFVKGVEINFDLSSYKSQYANDGSGGTVTEVGLGITKQLFNDRLSLTAGGSFDVGGETGASQVAGDFLLTYELTSSGNYLLKVFRRSDYDVLNEENAIKTGVGVSFRKQFENK